MFRVKDPRLPYKHSGKTVFFFGTLKVWNELRAPRLAAECGRFSRFPFLVMSRNLRGVFFLSRFWSSNLNSQ
uniref:Uncharacterized protein n=1 Tax=Anguilla anguilla TaxID=7936 RepID=A0A0E9XB79_ANGAN